MLKNKKLAFTIIELLIVISIIGVLAGLVLTVFGDAQKKARNTKTVNGVKAYSTALALYAVDHNSYPFTAPTCLGLGHEDNNLDGTGDCYWGLSHLNEDAAAMAILEPYIGQTEPANVNAVKHGSWTYQGASLEYNTANTYGGESNPYLLRYILEGFQVDCELQSAGGGTWGTFDSNNVNNWYRTNNTDNSTMCIIPLSNADN